VGEQRWRRQAAGRPRSAPRQEGIARSRPVADRTDADSRFGCDLSLSFLGAMFGACDHHTICNNDSMTEPQTTPDAPASSGQVRSVRVVFAALMLVMLFRLDDEAAPRADRTGTPASRDAGAGAPRAGSRGAPRRAAKRAAAAPCPRRCGRLGSRRSGARAARYERASSPISGGTKMASDNAPLSMDMHILRAAA
jgi:hypothetical protein